MGAWSVDAFGNDDAGDWADELDDAQDLSPVQAAVDAVLAVGEDYLEAPEATRALAAIEVIARLGGNPGEKSAYTDVVDNWVARTNVKPTVELVDKAQAAIARILAENSELKELWEDSDDFDAWTASVDDLRTRLGS